MLKGAARATQGERREKSEGESKPEDGRGLENVGEGWSVTWSIPFCVIMMEGGWHVGLIMQRGLGCSDSSVFYLMMEGGWI